MPVVFNSFVALINATDYVRGDFYIFTQDTYTRCVQPRPGSSTPTCRQVRSGIYPRFPLSSINSLAIITAFRSASNSFSGSI